MSEPSRFFVGITGASGVIYGVKLVGALARLGHHVDVAITDAGYRVLTIELGLRLDPQSRDGSILLQEAGSRIRILNNHSIESGPASGTYPLQSVFIVPCSMGTLARVAHGYASCLIERVADVALKEAKPLIIVPRETPLSRLHLDHLNRLAWAGARIVPAMPAFYQLPRTIDDLVDHLVGKILDAGGVQHSLTRRWGMPAPKGDPGARPDLEGDVTNSPNVLDGENITNPGEGLGEGCDA